VICATPLNYDFILCYILFNFNKNQEIKMKREGAILRKSYDFALEIVKLYDDIRENKKEFTLSKQLARSGTSIGANVTEAQHAESRLDFIHKLAISQKECNETIFWLNLLKDSSYITVIKYEELNSKTNKLLKMISSAIITSKNILKRT